MNVRPETPSLSGLFEKYTHSAPDIMEPNDLVYRDISNVQLKGEWRPEELRTASHALGSVVMFGNCVASDSVVEAALARSLGTNDLTVLTKLPGSYTTMVFQPDRLTVLADLANQFPFYYRHDERGLHFSSLTRPLREGAGRYSPDIAILAAQIALPGLTDLVAGRSMVAGVHRLEAGHALSTDRQGRVSVAPYETFQSPSLSGIDEAADLLRTALLDALRYRAALGYRITADFSGGLDSTSLAYLAARQLDSPLLVSTRYSHDVPSGDLAYAREYLALPASEGLFDAYEFEYPAAKTAYANLLDAPIGDEPSLSSLGHVRSAAYYQFLREHGSQLHLTGAGADSILDLDPRLYLGKLARMRTLRRFVGSLLEVGRTELTSPLSVLRDIHEGSRLDPATHFEMLSEVLQGRRHQQYDRKHVFGPGSAPEWLTEHACLALSDLASSRAAEVTIGPNADRGNYSAYADVRAMGAILHDSRQFAASFGLRPHAVFMDNAVLRACLSLPAHLRVNPWTFKALLVKATEGLVPDEVTSRSTKGDYSLHGVKGLRAAQGDIEELLHNSRLAGLGIIRPQIVRDSLERMRLGVKPVWGSLDRLIAAELWLRSLDDAREPIPDAPVLPQPSPQVQEVSLPKRAKYGMSDGVFIITQPYGAVAINIQNDTRHILNKSALHVVQALQSAGTFGGALAALQAVYPTVSRAQLEAGASKVIREWVSNGVLAEGLQTFSIAEGCDTAGVSSEAPMTRQSSEAAKTRMRDYPVAVGGLVMALALQRLSLKSQMNVLSKLHERWCNQPANEVDTLYMHAAVQRVSAPHIGRVACLEQSMATVLAAALKRQRVDLVIGLAANLDDLHAWPEVGGVAIQTTRDTQVTGVFKPIFRV